MADCSNLDVNVILTLPCTFRCRFYIPNIQGGVRMTLTSRARVLVHLHPLVVELVDLDTTFSGNKAVT
jgi:hypothetical protein